MARILILTHEFLPYRGGIAMAAEGLATGATLLGHEAIVVAPDYGRRTSAGGRAHGEPSAERFTVIRFPGSTCSMLSLSKLARFTRICRREIQRTRPDWIHAADPPAQMAIAALSRFCRLPPAFYTVHGSELLRYRNEPIPRLWMHGAFARVTGITAVSRAVFDLVIALGAPPARTFIAYPGITRPWFDTPPGDRAVERRRLGIGGDDLLLITLARRVADKGHLDVLAALAGLGGDLRQRIVYFVAGTGPEGYAAEIARAARGAQVRLAMPGEISVPAAIAACDAADLFVMPSRRTHKRLEGFGLAYLEAGARGLPALARDTGGVADAVHNGETGVVLPEDAGTDRMSAAIRELIENPGWRRRLGEQARTFAAPFTWERHAATVYGRFATLA
jgi:glycosyltransferase involved in cell wall biosynthesis